MKRIQISSHAITNIMEVGDIRLYKERWKAVEEIEHWGIARFGIVERISILIGIKTDDRVDRMQITLRWARIKELFEQGELGSSR